MHVIKFGGTSVASAKNISIVKDIIQEKQSDAALVVVVSALGGITNQLIECSELAANGDGTYLSVFKEIEEKHMSTTKTLIAVKTQGGTLSKIKMLLNELEDIFRGVFLIHELSDKTKDRVLSFGESLSAVIINDYLLDQGLSSTLADAKSFIITDNHHGRANVNFKLSDKKIKSYFKGIKLSICPGFVASTEEGETTTLGRGGSDYTAAILAASLNSEKLEIWTDVSGMMTADPRLVSSAYVINHISYEEAMELSHFGAKVIYPPTIQPVLEAGIPIHIKNTFRKEDDGTVISNKGNGNGQIIKGLSSIRNIALFNLMGSGMVGIPNFSHRLFRVLSAAKVNIILITQASSEHSICVGIAEEDVLVSEKMIKEEFEYELTTHKIDPLEIDHDLAIVALVGSNMQAQVGVSGQLFSTLAQNGVNVKAIAQGSSEKNISVVIHDTEVKKALNSLHENFFLSEKKTVNVFVIGVGNVGATLLSQILKQKSYLAKHHHIDVRIVALANSRKMYFDQEGIDLNSWEDILQNEGEEMEMHKFIFNMEELNLRNSVFIDNTANVEVARLYEAILKESISVVTPNKIACTESYEKYLSLKKTALRYHSKFLFETNVGAGLPVINTLNDLVKSGDEVLEIQAVLSGSLNFIFNNFNADVKFADIVRQAQTEGYTEPDPRIDLSGVDVMRKLLILIRESGIEMELDDIDSKQFIPKPCMDASSVELFFDEVEKEEEAFQTMLKEAGNAQKRMKYVASFKNGKASTGLQLVGADHPFYNLEGKDNIVLFTTKRYPEQPLVIKGAGAGAEVTAMGVFSDIIRIAHG
ncbi:MAG: bifunctional aspartate kinase/homoserine dehydrogenase I [Cyclobacteriaceae bacterium]|nr:bifunctional aspartate kinase/homoserine dehydrogenase I [Cyclobacteriaceae bacterium]